MEGKQGGRTEREGSSRSLRTGEAAKDVPLPSEASSDVEEDTTTAQEKRSAEYLHADVPPAKQRVVEEEEDDRAELADPGEQVTADLDAVLAAFKEGFRQELEQAMPRMVGRALTKSLVPIMKKQQEMAENQAQRRKDINLLREGQAKQSIDMTAQIAKLTEEVQAMSAGGPLRAHV